MTGECDPAFELAVDAVVFGRMEELDRLWADTPISSGVARPSARWSAHPRAADVAEDIERALAKR